MLPQIAAFALKGLSVTSMTGDSTESMKQGVLWEGHQMFALKTTRAQC